MRLLLAAFLLLSLSPPCHTLDSASPGLFVRVVDDIDIYISPAGELTVAYAESSPTRRPYLANMDLYHTQELDAGLINVNTASKATLKQLPGIGNVLADRIIAGRPYQRVDDLLDVSGIGPSKLATIRPLIRVD